MRGQHSHIFDQCGVNYQYLCADWIGVGVGTAIEMVPAQVEKVDKRWQDTHSRNMGISEKAGDLVIGTVD